jgi:uncharacterized protein YkwD
MITRPSHAVAFLLGFAVALWIFLPLAAPPAFSGEPGARGASGDPELERLAADLFEAVNRFRSANHKIPLQRRRDLDGVAHGHSADMAGRGYLAHESPEGRNWVDRLTLAKVEGFAMAGENVGLTSKPDPNREILEGWIHSPVHRENLLAAAFNATGLGVSRSADGTLYYTQLYLTFPR